MLTGAYHLSRRKTQKLLCELVGIEVSLGAISAMEQRASEALASAHAEALREVQYAVIKHADATSWTRSGKVMSLWMLASEAATVYQIFVDGCRDTIGPMVGPPLGILPEKGQMGLVQAFASLHAAGVDAELRLIGDGPDEERLMRQVKEHDLEQCCLLLGRLGEADSLREIADADVLVLPSLMEGLPVVLMEALGIGVSVIAPRVAGIPELVHDGQNGLLYAPGRWDELATCMGRVAADAELRRALGRAGRQLVFDEFDVAKAVQPLFERFNAS